MSYNRDSLFIWKVRCDFSIIGGACLSLKIGRENNLLLAIGMGDAYGAGFEFAPQEKIINHNNLTAYQQHGLGIEPGHYTDDTQMSLAIAELLLGHQDWNQATIAEAFVCCFKRDKRLGYSKNMYRLLDMSENGLDFLDKVISRSTANGAAMRSVPLGVIADVSELLKKSAIQASVTHDNSAGIQSSQAIALASHFFLHKTGRRHQLFDFVCAYSDYRWDNRWCAEVACDAIETVNAVLTVLENAMSLSEVLIQSVGFGGDVDTVAACALGTASLSNEYEQDLPSFLYQDLENGCYGKDYLLDVGERLLNTFGLIGL
jgi:ADP-ribosylglycohydrolase